VSLGADAGGGLELGVGSCAAASDEDGVPGTSTVPETSPGAGGSARTCCELRRDGEGVEGREEPSHPRAAVGEELGGGDDGGSESILCLPLSWRGIARGVDPLAGGECAKGEVAGRLSSSSSCAGGKASIVEDSGVGAVDVLGVDFFEAGKTTSIIRLDRVRRVAGPGPAAAGTPSPLGPVLADAGPLGASVVWT
jgi:hypothetical protein